ncbi:protein-arginine deiminase type-1 isoform X2 [Microcaecilia unicolor]|uniref:protein-arginine deiminase n=1 Tax=Microcaecilia unicolor TaxID=1415580 RepID=A0A6P7WL18_9AMPH|nr:protein-arginine deiminase type-1-like isoform X2 [Microcaecilia unicolor]
MSERKTIHISTSRPTYAVCVVGTEIIIDVYRSMPPDAVCFDVRGTRGTDITILYNPTKLSEPRGTSIKWPLNKEVEVVVCPKASSANVNGIKVKVSYYGNDGNTTLGIAMLYLTSVEISLDVDTSRNGVVNKNGNDKTSWTWGPDGHGAVLLVNCDKDNVYSKNMDNDDTRISKDEELKDFSQMILTVRGPDAIFHDYKLLLHIALSDLDKVGVFRHHGGTNSRFEHVLGTDKLYYEVERKVGEEEIIFYVEGLTFPDVGFSGLVTINLNLQDTAVQGLPVFTDMVVFRVAPWIMTPNTLEPVEVFVCSVPNNSTFLAEVTDLVERKARCKLTVCGIMDNRGDRWIQDEMEFGYTQAPQKSFPVVFDSPRDGKLKDFPFKKILGPDFGYVTREPVPMYDVSSLDSFGNLEVSPPVTVNGKVYPLGRILIGSSMPRSGGRKMTKVARDFLFAQKVQAPVELFSDWLQVGHVDEFMTFVPSSDRKGFRLLLASPNACYQLFEEIKQQGYGDAAMFQGLSVPQPTINNILKDKFLKKENDYFQNCIDWNRDILKKQLGLTEQDIVDIPILFKMENGFADAYFPNMVNLVVLGKDLGVAKPFGPIINGKCCLEKAMISLLEPLGLRCTFIDDYYSYHLNLGEVHCGTNVRRKPFPIKWWNTIP